MAVSTIINFDEAKDRRRLYGVLKRQRGKCRVEICKYRRRRSDRQNRFYWPCFVHPFASFLREQGEAITDEDAHEILKHRFLRREVVDDKTGEVMPYTKSTTELTTTEFNQYLDLCAAWLNDMFGFVMPDPQDYHERAPKESPPKPDPDFVF